MLSDFEPCGETHNGAGFCSIPRSQHSELNSYHRIVTSSIFSIFPKIQMVHGKFKSTAPNEESTCDTLMSLLGDLIEVCQVKFIISTETQASETDIFKAKCEIVHKMFEGHPKDFFFPTCLVCLNNPSYPILSCSDKHMWCCEDCASHLIDSQGTITCSACQNQAEIRSEKLYLYTLMMCRISD